MGGYGNLFTGCAFISAELARSEDITLLDIVQILRKLWVQKRGVGDIPLVFIDDAHLRGNKDLFLDEDARADIQLLLEVAWAGLCYVVMGTSEEAGAESLLAQRKSFFYSHLRISICMHCF